MTELSPPMMYGRTFISGVAAPADPYAMTMVGCAEGPEWRSRGTRCSPPKYSDDPLDKVGELEDPEPKADWTALPRASVEIPVPRTARLDFEKASRA